MLKFILLACVVALVAAQNGHHQNHQIHQNHHTNEHAFMFFVDEDMGDLVMETQSHCYLYALSDSEKMDVKDPVKEEALEVLFQIKNQLRFRSNSQQ